jgi:hypothetical protein
MSIKAVPMRGIIFLPVLVIFLFLLSGCVLTSVNPLGNPEAPVTDPDLPGLWVRSDPSDEGYMLITDNQDGYYSFFTLDQNYKSEDKLFYKGFVTEIGGKKFLSIKMISINRLTQVIIEPEYNLAYYRIDNKDQLVLSLLSKKFFEDAVNAGSLKGEITVSKYSNTSVKLTDTTENLAAFISAQDINALIDPEPMNFRKMSVLH